MKSKAVDSAKLYSRDWFQISSVINYASSTIISSFMARMHPGSSKAASALGSADSES